jgi:hypothetical protein
VKSYRQKISKWQGQVSERLQVLNRRGGNHSRHELIMASSFFIIFLRRKQFLVIEMIDVE